MNTIRILTAASVGLVLTAGVALAHELDADQDGLFSLAEMQDEYTDLTQAQYDALDLNKDGALDAAELQAAIDSGKLTKIIFWPGLGPGDSVISVARTGLLSSLPAQHDFRSLATGHRPTAEERVLDGV